MRIDPALESGIAAKAANGRNEEEMRRVAAEFEAVLLGRFTAALNPPADEEGDLFRSDATDMYRQMFSEQMAKTIAEGGGVGLAEIILRQLRAGSEGGKAAAPALDRARSAARMLRSEPAAAGRATAPVTGRTTNRRDDGEPFELQLPVTGRLTSQFGARRDPIHGHRRFHRGLDIAAPRGTPIEAAAEGRVVFAGRQRGYGNTVIIEHSDGRRTRYAHAQTLHVKAGDSVAAGQAIATVGATGRATGPHLHFEVIEDGRQIDPLEVLAKDFSASGR
jgi:murein DD-endopeptidase MepM/ murein hydrolase activator NlpD